jgi:hypothetical protein
MARRLKVPDGIATEPGAKLNGLHCSVCGELQFDTEAGATCKNGHGGEPGVGPQELPALKARLAEETSKALKTEMTRAELDEKVKRAQGRVTFGSSNAATKSPMRDDMVRLVETIWVDDIEAEAKFLIEALKLGEQRNDRGSVVKSTDDVQYNALRAHALYVTCVREREAWEKRNDVIFAGMRIEANAALQDEKAKGQRNKTITNADTDAMMALLFGDQWVIQEKERRDYKLAEDHMKNLAERWAARSQNLKSIADTLR